KNKDQSYFLCRIPKDSLEKILFPLGGMHKTAVRLLAEKLKLPNAKRKDSTGICFIGKRRFDDFISGYLLNKPGVIQTLEGKEIGKHDGLFYYTIGQRKGLKIGGGKHFDETPWYVIDKDMTTRTLIVAQGQNHPALFKKTLQVDDMHWLKNAPGNYFKAHAKIRHRQNDQTCYVTVLNNDKSKIEIVFEEKQRAITPGQYAVLYQNEICLGGGAISETSA
ncbi:MAG: tRNA 2-thiouridine(34) synthase MnmA, partial [Pseudomonadota bacterium]|nr:tRNA 2-thiouridine(34) synthase MnmA [Pseudomonadota bacterium]